MKLDGVLLPNASSDILHDISSWKCFSCRSVVAVESVLSDEPICVGVVVYFGLFHPMFARQREQPAWDLLKLNCWLCSHPKWRYLALTICYWRDHHFSVSVLLWHVYHTRGFSDARQRAVNVYKCFGRNLRVCWTVLSNLDFTPGWALPRFLTIWETTYKWIWLQPFSHIISHRADFIFVIERRNQQGSTELHFMTPINRFTCSSYEYVSNTSIGSSPRIGRQRRVREPPQ